MKVKVTECKECPMYDYGDDNHSPHCRYPDDFFIDDFSLPIPKGCSLRRGKLVIKLSKKLNNINTQKS